MFLILSILFPSFLASIFCISTPKKYYNKIYSFGILCAFLTAVITIHATYVIFAENTVLYIKIGNIFGNAIIDFKTSGRSMLFCSMIAILYPLSLLYAIAYARVNDLENRRIFFCFFHLSIMSGLAFGLSANLLTMFIFYEMITLSTYPLVAHNRDAEAKKSARIYLTYLIASSSLLFLPAILIIQAIVGNTNFVYGGILAGHKISINSINILFAMMIFGIAKAAIFPVHNWLPNAMTAPTPVSSILHAVVVVKSGLFAIISVIYFIFGAQFLRQSIFTFYGENWLTILSVVTIFIMSIVAIFQDNIKKRLAYSTIAQLSYAILAASMFSGSAMKVALLLMIAHAFAKIILFFGAGIIYSYFNKTHLSQIYGIGKDIPVFMIAMCVACVSLIGLPITIGFMAKYELLSMVIKYKNLAIIVAIIVSTLLSVSYCFPIVYNTMFAKNHNIIHIRSDINKNDDIIFTTVMIICTLIVIMLFFATNFIDKLINII